MRRWQYRRFAPSISLFILLALICLPLLATPRPAHAATITVNSTADNGPGNCSSTCTLRDAIAAANANDTITFSVSGTITLTGGTLTIAKNLTIQAATAIVVDGNHATSVFTINSGTVSISGLTIQHGRSTDGGGIFNAGSLTMSGDTLSGNAASTAGGGIFN